MILKKKIRLMSNSAFGKIMENVRKHRGIKLAATKIRRKYLVSEPNYHTRNFLTENLSAIEMEKPEILMNKPAHLGLSILELGKILIYEFWYNYVKPKYSEKPKLFYINTNNCIVWIKIDDIYEDIAEDVETRFDTSNYELECNFIDR